MEFSERPRRQFRIINTNKHQSNNDVNRNNIWKFNY